MITTPATLTHKYDSPSGNVSYVLFQLDHIFPFAEGQFVMIEQEINGVLLKRPYSIATTNNQLQQTKQLGIIVKKTSDEGMSDRLTNKIQIGDNVMVKGPVGHYTDPKIYLNYLLISAGSGLSPNFGLFQSLINNKTQFAKIVNIFGERNTHELIPEVQDFFWAHTSDTMRHIFFLSQEQWPPEGYRQGYIQDGLEEAIDFLGLKTTCFVCGNSTLVTDVSERLQILGIEKKDIVIEKY